MAIQNVQYCSDTGKTESFNYSSFPGTTIGNSVLFRNNCFEVIDSSDPLATVIPDAAYTDCYDCFTSNNAVIYALNCVNESSVSEAFFNVTDFGFIPQIGEVYYLTFVSPQTGGLITSCFNINRVIIPEKPASLSVLVEPPVLEIDCETCILNNETPYIVRRCVDGSLDIVNFIDDTYLNHTITYTVGLDIYCGVVEKAMPGDIVNGFFVSDYSSSSGDAICLTCNETVAEKRILTNCVNGATEVVWNSPFFTSGNTSHFDTKYGCFSVGDLTTSGVTLSGFLDFDPQPNCQDCIQCNGIGLVLEPCGGGDSYNVGSYQYADIGDVIYDPYSDICSTVINYWSFNPIGGSELYTFYSFVTGGTDCTFCQSLETPISYYAEECITGNFVVITFDSTSTIGIGDIVRAKWGSSDFLCYTILGVYDGVSYGIVTDFLYSDTTTSFTSCDDCKNTNSLGVTLVNCNTYEERYVNVNIPTWVTMTGYDDNLGSHVVKGSDGQCYYLVNNCPITPIYDTFTTNEYFYYCFQCIPAGSSSCKCYYGVGSPDSIVEGSYIDCGESGQTKSFYSDNGIVRFCGTLITGDNVLDSGRFCEDNGCPDFCCNCYTINNNSGSKIYVQYLDCTYNLVSIQINNNDSSSFCGLNVQYLVLGNYTPKIPNNVTVTVDTCVNGQCLSSLSTKDQLLYKINTTLGPCPSNCCGKNASTGAYLLKNNGNTSGTYSIR